MTHHKVVFGVSPPTGEDEPTTILFGISTAAWDFMKEGNTHTFDLTSLGLPIRILMYGKPTHEEALKVIHDYNKRLGVPMIDKSGEDFGIKEKK